MDSGLIADWLIDRVSINLGGREHQLVITYGVLLECEHETGLDCLNGVEAFVSPSLRSLRALLCAILRRHDPGMSPHQVGALLTSPTVIQSVLWALRKAFVASMPDPEPRQKQKGKKEEPEEPTPITGWIELRAAARIEIGLPTDELLAMTPCEFHALRRAYVKSMRHWELIAGQVIAAVKNHSMNPPKKWAQAKDFLLHRLPEDEKKSAAPGYAEFDAKTGAISFQAV